MVLAASSAFTLASAPLALHFLSQERFGLWSLMSYVALVLGLIDFSMSGSVARLLIDHKDNRGGGEYGSLVKTGFLVLVLQGAIAFAVGFVLAPLLCRVENIEPELQHDFIALMRWQCGVLALGFASRIFNHLLTAHQRFDIVNYSQVAAMVLNLGVPVVVFRSPARGVQPGLGQSAQFVGRDPGLRRRLLAIAALSARRGVGAGFVASFHGAL